MAEKWDRRWERPMRSLSKSGKRTYHFDGIDVLPIEDFLKQLHQGDAF